MVPDLLVLPPGVDLHNHPLVLNGSVFMQVRFIIIIFDIGSLKAPLHGPHYLLGIRIFLGTWKLFFFPLDFSSSSLIICLPQGKASSMAAAALQPEPGWEVSFARAILPLQRPSGFAIAYP